MSNYGIKILGTEVAARAYCRALNRVEGLVAPSGDQSFRFRGGGRHADPHPEEVCTWRPHPTLSNRFFVGPLLLTLAARLDGVTVTLRGGAQVTFVFSGVTFVDLDAIESAFNDSADQEETGD